MPLFPRMRKLALVVALLTPLGSGCMAVDEDIGADVDSIDEGLWCQDCFGICIDDATDQYNYMITYECQINGHISLPCAREASDAYAKAVAECQKLWG